MSIIPQPLSRCSSTWSIIRSLDTLSPPPSSPSLDNLTACCQVGSIPLMLYAGVGDLSNSINDTLECSDDVQDISGTVDRFDLAYKGGSVPDDNTGIVSTESCIHHKSPKYLNVKSQAETRLMKSLPQATHIPPPRPMATLPGVEFVQIFPSNSPSTFESSPERSRRYYVPNGPVHAASENSPTSCFRSLGTQKVSRGSSYPETRDSSGIQGPSEHRRDGSTSTTNSELSSHSNAPLVAYDVYGILSEDAGIGSVRFPLLPISLSWLQSTALEVMIDQEGFRMIKPVFKLAGYSRPTMMESEVASLDAHIVSATVDFMPLQRKSFTFHHSALDTPPVLRRLMINGDGSRDYLSRQAYLILKANGPYTVQGTEPVQSPRLSPAGEPPVLVWRFDYFVADRRTEAGRIIPGEKTLTPLSFSCSPGLLQPTQAKKIRVVHVVKKSVAAKLTATKVEPPMPPSPCPVHRATPLSNAGSDLRGAVTGNLKHRRARSNTLQNTLTLGISTHDSAQLTSLILLRDKSGASPSLSDSTGPPKIRVGASRAIVSTEIINTLFAIETSHVVIDD